MLQVAPKTIRHAIDEPHVVEAVLALLRARCDDGLAGVLVTHEARYAAVADRVVFLTDGRVVDQAAAGAPLPAGGGPGAAP